MCGHYREFIVCSCILSDLEQLQESESTVTDSNLPRTRNLLKLINAFVFPSGALFMRKDFEGASPSLGPKLIRSRCAGVAPYCTTAPSTLTDGYFSTNWRIAN